LDELIKTIILGAPNLAVALYVLYRQQKTIDALLEAQNRLVDRLLAYVDRDKLRAEGIRTIPPPS